MYESMEQRQRRTDADLNREDDRRMMRERFATPLADDLFALGSDAMRTQAAFVPPPIKENDASRLAAIADEMYSEGRLHRNLRPQRHE